jgi:hypothetical protein
LEVIAENSKNAETADPAWHASDGATGFRSGSRMHALLPWVCLLAAWVTAVAAGCAALAAYAAAPGAMGQTLRDWPPNSVIPLDKDRPTLLMSLHPLCPCSSASVDELCELVGRCRNRVSAHVLILRTPSLNRERGARFDRSLASVPEITTWDDESGALSRRFGVLTSGHVLLYDPGGRLLYSGGITPARGHRGDNAGRTAVLAEILGEPCERPGTPTFGCPLFESQPPLNGEAYP